MGSTLAPIGRLAKKRAQGEGLQVLFKEGDARNPRCRRNSSRCCLHHGTSFRLLLQQEDDEKVLTAVGKILSPSGQLVSTSPPAGKCTRKCDKRSWEWIDEPFRMPRTLDQPGRRAHSS